MFAYPWDLEMEGPQALVRRVAELGITRLTVATTYHSAELVHPRRTDAVVMTAEANRSHLPLPTGTFTGLACPPSSLASRRPDLFPEVLGAAQESGVAVSGWIVGLHNSDLAQHTSEAALVNCFGDTLTHGLCPASPSVRKYARELVGGVAGTGLFDRVFVESMSYLLHGHGHPHELAGMRLDPCARYLLSMCFCSSCVALGENRDIDVIELRRRVAGELHRTWNRSNPAGRADDDGTELASLLMAWSDLLAYTQMRLSVVSTLVADLVDAAHQHGAELDVSAAVWARPAPLNWMEGIDIGRTLAVADGFGLASYYPDAEEVAREIDHVSALGPVERVEVALTLWPSHHGSLDGFLAKVMAVRAAGVRSLALYNFGTATTDSLTWAAAAAREMAR